MTVSDVGYTSFLLSALSIKSAGLSVSAEPLNSSFNAKYISLYCSYEMSYVSFVKLNDLLKINQQEN